MIKVDIIIFKGIVINLYDITVALIFFCIISRERRRRARRAGRRPRLYVCTLWRCLLCQMY